MPQGRFIFPMLTVRENLETGFACLPRDERVIPPETYHLFPVLKTMLDRRGGDLSGGQQQMLALSKAVLLEPELLLIDELSLGLAPVVVQDLLKVVEQLQDLGITMVIMITHK